MWNSRVRKGLDLQSEISFAVKQEDLERPLANGGEKPRLRWFYAACICLFCFGLLSILIALGEDRFVAKAAVFAVGHSPSSYFDLPLTSKLPERVLRQVVEGEGLAADPEFGAQWNWIARAGIIFGLTDRASRRNQARDQAVLALGQAVAIRGPYPSDARTASNDPAAVHHDLPHLVLEIEVSSLEADKAARLANALAQAVVDEQGRNAAAEEAHRQAIRNEVTGFATRLQIAKQNLADFHDAQDQRSSGDETGAIGDHADTITTLADAKADVDLVSHALAAGRTSNLISLHFATPELDRSLSQYADLEQRYQKSKLTLGDKHPDLVALDGQVRAAQKDIRNQWLKIADTATRNYRAAQARAATGTHVASALPEAKLDPSLERLQSGVDEARRDYDHALLLQAKEESSPASETSLSVAQANPPALATHKPHGFIVGAAMMLGAMFGAGRTLVEGRRNPRRKPVEKMPIEKTASSKTPTPQKRKSSSFLPIPRIKRDWLSEKLRLKLQLDAACREVLERPRSAFSQAIANLLEREIGLESRETVKALFISKADGLGATTIAVNVAQMAANAGARVLLIEANRQRPVLASLISPQVSVDLIDLAGTRRIICRLRPGFSVIPLFEEETSGLLEERARQCIKGIGRHFDLVIVDGGTFADDDIETMELVDSVNRVFHLTPEGIELKTGRRAFQRRR